MRGAFQGFALAFWLLAGAAPAQAGCMLNRYAEVPVTVDGGRAQIHGKIDGTDVRLTVDTGASFSTLSPAAASRLGLRPGPLPAGLTVRGFGGAASVKLVTVKTFTLAGVALHDVDLFVSDHDLESGDGLVGENLLGFLDAEFDFAGGALRLFKPDGCGDRPLSYWDPDARGAMAIDVMPGSVEGPSNVKIAGTVTVNGVPLRATFDTGAYQSLISERAAGRAGVQVTDPGVTPGAAAAGVGHRMSQSWVAPFALIDIGGEQIKNTRLVISGIDLPGEDMIVGLDFFLSHRIYVSRTQHKLYFTYNGGPVFRLGQPDAAAVAATTTATAPAGGAGGPEEPKTAAGYVSRGADLASRQQYALAIKDFSSAIALEPADPEHLIDRAQAYARTRQLDLAAADLDQALKLKPDDVRALLMRGGLRLGRKDVVGAQADFDLAISHDPSVRLSVANAYSAAELFEPAIANYNQWIANHPRNADLAQPLNGRCWARALLGRDLDKALADCNASLDLWSGVPATLDTRGLVFLRMGNLKRAIIDYTAALKLQPRIAWSLYGRGLAERRDGEIAAGDADTAAALAIQPNIAEEFKKHGISG